MKLAVLVLGLLDYDIWATIACHPNSDSAFPQRQRQREICIPSCQGGVVPGKMHIFANLSPAKQPVGTAGTTIYNITQGHH